MAPNITTIAPATKPNAIVATRPENPPTCAYVTFLAGNGDYVKGVVGLMKGLRKVRSKYPLVVAVLPDVPEEHRKILVDQGCIVREIEPVYPPENQTQFAMAYYVINYSKLRIWEFVEYEKMIYLDGDIQVYDNIDHLFDLPDGQFYAVMDCFCEKTCLPTYHDLLKTLQVTPPTPFAEQDFLNMYFRDIYCPIPPIYNLVLAMLWRHPENIHLDHVKVVHYCAAGSKPWRYTGKEENMDRGDIKMLVKKWWDICNDETLDHKNYVAPAEDTEAVNLQRFLAALLEAGIFHDITAPSAA
ncbi:hypothetical protein CRG98_035074 [Punica granatum]|uniref:Hexosyltransferase n=1 Tax=Punica granatum TaxID=22663 RepID=A0A2I0IMD7_PUNGR|nr:hypothetical protein CRG98_035074 [Punica granatum]